MTKIHSIQQQHLHVRLYGNESDGLTLQKRLPDICQTWLAPALEQVLNRYAPQVGHLVIEHLEINAGTIALERLEHDLVESVTQAVEKILRDLPQSCQLPTPIATGNVQHKTEPEFIFDAFLYFLRLGRLPWSFHVPEGKSLEQVILDTWRDNLLNPNIDALHSVLTLSSTRKRLVRQFSEVFLATLLERIAPDLKKIIDAILPRLQSAEIPADVGQTFIMQLWETSFTLIHGHKNHTETAIIRKVWHTLPLTMARQSPLAKLLEQHWPSVTSNAEPFLAAQKNRTANNRPDQFSKTTSDTAQQHSIADTDTTSVHTVPASGNITDSNSGPIIDLGEIRQSSPSPEEKEGIYITNTGLILLHPFLPQFFRALNIADEDTLIQPERALCLLHFLASGQRIAPEYELVLPKILCNVSLETPVASCISLADSEIEEATALLEAVIRHWEVLKNTGIDGLRGTFLLRAGKITLQDDGDWRLQVDNKVYDILLGQLPWAIGMIKLPWMQTTLWVEWA